MKTLSVPGFVAGAALHTNRAAVFQSASRGLGFQGCFGPVCICGGLDDCINMIVFTCGPDVYCTDFWPYVCFCWRG